MSRYGELTAKVDAFFARVEARHGAQMQCATGCADCCRARLSVTGVEAAAIEALVRALPADARAALAALVAARDGDARCAALGDDDRCRIYAARPIVCRSHGAPVRLRDGKGLPVVSNCFRHDGLVPDADCVIDQTTLSAMVLAVDRDAGGDGGRTLLSEVLARVAGDG